MFARPSVIDSCDLAGTTENQQNCVYHVAVAVQWVCNHYSNQFWAYRFYWTIWTWLNRMRLGSRQWLFSRSCKICDALKCKYTFSTQPELSIESTSKKLNKRLKFIETFKKMQTNQELTKSINQTVSDQLSPEMVRKSFMIKKHTHTPNNPRRQNNSK